MNLFQKYLNLNIDGSLISLEYSKITTPYFCYPTNAEVIGFEGCILYCFLPEYGEMVFASNPDSCSEKCVYPLARNFEDFMRLVITCGSANPIEQIIWMNKEQFNEHLRNEKAIQTDEQTQLIEKLSNELNLSLMEFPFEYVKELQKDFDDSKIQFSDEYYDVLGIPLPAKCNLSKDHYLEFEPVTFKFNK